LPEVRIGAGWSDRRWKEVPYKRDAYGTWIEFRLGDDDNRARAIVCYDRKAGVIYLVARTAIHDHRALNELVASFSPRRPP
jgi:hypothetical protein